MQFGTLTYGYGLPEGPRIDKQNRLYVRRQAGGVFRRRADGANETLIPNRKMVGGIALNEGGGFGITCWSLAKWDAPTGQIRALFGDWDGKPLFGINYITTDENGSVWGGTFGVDITKFDFKTKPAPGFLFRVDPPATLTKLWEGIEVTNGLGFSPDRKLLYHCDSTTRAVWVYEVKADLTVSERRKFADLPEGMPDGMTVDAEGGVWVAVVAGVGEGVRFKSDGTLDRRGKIPAKTVTSVPVGGPDLQELD